MVVTTQSAAEHQTCGLPAEAAWAGCQAGSAAPALGGPASALAAVPTSGTLGGWSPVMCPHEQLEVPRVIC